MNTSSLLEQELAPLNAQIELNREKLSGLEQEMRATEAELETFSAERLRFDLLRDACNLLDRLDELQAGKMFWGEEIRDPAGHMAGLRSRIAGFDEKIGGVLERQTNLKAQANRCADELENLYDEVQNAYNRDERRAEEFAIVRELSPDPDHVPVMPWSSDTESDRRYRRNMQTAMFLSLVLAIIVRLVTVPVPPRPVVAQIPERLAMMVRQEPVKAKPVKKTHEEKKDKKPHEKAEKEVAKKETVKEAAPKAQEKAQAAAKAAPAPVAQGGSTPKKSETAGMLAFKDSFKDLIDETPTPKLGTEARLTNNSAQNAGRALPGRSLVSIQGAGGGAGGGGGGLGGNGGSGGIGRGAGTGRGVGNGGGNEGKLGRGGGPGGNGFAQVKSSIGGGSGGGGEGKSAGSGGRPTRTDEEIQILFDRYKAALYRIYNTELRKDPTLRGKMVLKITIEPSGVVSACGVDSTNMNAPPFCDQIVERVKKFNFGPKDGVPKMTILYPIDFLPAR